MPAISKTKGKDIAHSSVSTKVPLHLANVNGITYLRGNEDTDGSVRQVESSGLFKLQKRLMGIWTDVQASDEFETKLLHSVKTGVGSFHLGELHNMSSAGENVVFKNNNTNICFFPVWQGITPDGVTLISPAARVYSTIATSYPNGATSTSGAVGASQAMSFPANTSVFAVSLVSAETYSGKLRWSVVLTPSNIEVVSFDFDVTLTPGAVINLPFEAPLDARAGASTVGTLKKLDGTLFTVYPSSTIPTSPWYSITSRPFTDSLVYHEGNIMSVAETNTPLPDSTTGSAGTRNFFSRGDHVHPFRNIPNVQRFTTPGSATYTPTAGMRYCIIEAYGAGGAGGTTSVATIVQVSGAGAGGSGGYTKVMATAAQVGASLALTIGAKGVASNTANSTGGSGGQTVVGSMFTCGGGAGGQPTVSLVGAVGAVGGLGGAGGVDSAVTGCTFLEGCDGDRGDNTIVSGGTIFNGRGGSTVVGRGGFPGGTATGTSTTSSPGIGIGSGGGGAAVNGLAGYVKGGDGANGAVIITEYFA